MVNAIRVRTVGGPEVLKWEEVEVKEASAGEVLVHNKAIGVNFLDTYIRKGSLPIGPPPFIPGTEAVGEVIAIGAGVSSAKIGDYVGYAGFPLGSYSEQQILPSDRIVAIPSSIDPITAASSLAKGMTAQMLVRRCFKLEPGHVALVHAAAGGVGSLLCQWASSLGATVIGTVSTNEKAEQAREDGCRHVVLYKDEDFVARVMEITGGEGVHVVYDAVGKDTFQGSLTCLRTRGVLVSYGQASGAPDPVLVHALSVKSATLMRPSIVHYTATREELVDTAAEVFKAISEGVLRVRTSRTYPLRDAAQAHSDLESRKTTGSVVLIP